MSIHEQKKETAKEEETLHGHKWKAAKIKSQVRKE